jgi:hypothetical protein
MTKKKVTRTIRRAAKREGEKFRKIAEGAAVEVEVGLKKVVNSLPILRRLGIAARIIGGRWK